MNDEVVLPQLEPSVDVQELQDGSVIEQENEQKALEVRLRNEVEHPNFPIIRQHFEQLIKDYGNVATLVDLSEQKFVAEARAKAVIVKELQDLLTAIDQLTEVDVQDASD
jgi:hypothetical protein